MWVPWRLGDPAQQRAAKRARGRVKGVMTHREALLSARKAHRKKAFSALKRGRMTAHEYQARYGGMR